MMLLDSEALSAVAHGPPARRDRVAVYPVDTRTGVRAGQLLGSIAAGSELAVDAFVVAVADLAGGAIIATVDVSDMERLAARTATVAVADVA